MQIVRWILGASFTAVLAVTVVADSGKKFVITDDCAPDPGWAPTGGCLIEGSVSFAEFGAANALGFPGHPAWLIDPPYVAGQNQDDIRVENTGGRNHTFTEVTRFGGGYVGGLNAGATPAAECVTVGPTGAISPSPAALNTTLAPGNGLSFQDLAPGTHNFQCCIHPWMRTTVKIDPQQGHEH